METKSTTERLKEVLAKETNKFAEKDSVLKDAYTKFAKIGIETKATYNLPLIDTLGKTFREQLQFQLTEQQNPVANIGYTP
ncbi:MAG: hypothetical protein HY738_06715 [Bacteroidia bacterium]|nr:hypothetical protein [Bacteroidia bacterium]